MSEGERRARGTSVCVSIVAESMDRSIRFDSIRFDSIRFVRTMVSSVAHNRSTRVVSHRARERPSRSAGPRFQKRRALDASERARRRGGATGRPPPTRERSGRQTR